MAGRGCPGRNVSMNCWSLARAASHGGDFRGSPLASTSTTRYMRSAWVTCSWRTSPMMAGTASPDCTCCPPSGGTAPPLLVPVSPLAPEASGELFVGGRPRRFGAASVGGACASPPTGGGEGGPPGDDAKPPAPCELVPVSSATTGGAAAGEPLGDSAVTGTAPELCTACTTSGAGSALTWNGFCCARWFNSRAFSLKA